MSFRINSIILYNKNGKQRIVEFPLDKVTIITGDNKVGKTNILEIIDYCLCARNCNTTEKVMKYVEYYGLHLQIENQAYIVVRKAPKDHFKDLNQSENHESSTCFYISPQNSYPNFEDLEKELNYYNLFGARKFITELLYSNNTSNNIDLFSIRNALAFCFIRQVQLQEKSLFYSNHGNDSDFLELSL